MLGVVASNLTIFKLQPTTPNMSQHVATGWPNAHNMLCPTMLRYVAICCVDMLRSFGRGFRMKLSPLRETEQIGGDKSTHSPILPEQSQDSNDDDFIYSCS